MGALLHNSRCVASSAFISLPRFTTTPWEKQKVYISRSFQDYFPFRKCNLSLQKWDHLWWPDVESNGTWRHTDSMDKGRCWRWDSNFFASFQDVDEPKQKSWERGARATPVMSSTSTCSTVDLQQLDFLSISTSIKSVMKCLNDKLRSRLYVAKRTKHVLILQQHDPANVRKDNISRAKRQPDSLWCCWSLPLYYERTIKKFNSLILKTKRLRRQGKYTRRTTQ